MGKVKYHHRARLATRRGLTAMWQVSGWSKITDFGEVVKMDTEYIDHWCTLGYRVGYKDIAKDCESSVYKGRGDVRPARLNLVWGDIC